MGKLCDVQPGKTNNHRIDNLANISNDHNCVGGTPGGENMKFSKIKNKGKLYILRGFGARMLEHV